MKDKFQQGFNIINEGRNSPEREILEVVSRFQLPVYYFQAAYKDFTDKAKYIEENFDETVENRYNFPNDLAQITRYIFIFLVSAHSLRDCQKSYIRTIKTDYHIEIPELDKEIRTRFKDQPIPNIIAEMRNRYSHAMPPVCSKTWNISEGKKMITLPKADNLSLYKKLNLPAKTYWDSFTHQQLDLIEMFGKYYALIMDFYSWFLSAVEKAVEPIKKAYFYKQEQGIRLTRESFFDDFMKKRGDVAYEIDHELLQFNNKDDYDGLMKKPPIQRIELLIFMLINDGILSTEDISVFRNYYIQRYIK
ncbi:MAG: hypothetical protein LUH22_20505 [Bacteroides sp.]|nr:hypothetical protein [Bacteroides sp.]